MKSNNIGSAIGGLPAGKVGGGMIGGQTSNQSGSIQSTNVSGNLQKIRKHMGLDRELTERVRGHAHLFQSWELRYLKNNMEKPEDESSNPSFENDKIGDDDGSRGYRSTKTYPQYIDPRHKENQTQGGTNSGTPGMFDHQTQGGTFETEEEIQKFKDATSPPPKFKVDLDDIPEPDDGDDETMTERVRDWWENIKSI